MSFIRITSVDSPELTLIIKRCKMKSMIVVVVVNIFIRCLCPLYEVGFRKREGK